jgi:short subunit dehydrogenase-like uncharacterized protein
VFEQCRARDAEARSRGVVLLPGVGFDVVPTDCLAQALAKALPGAVRLELAFQALGSLSRGTGKTMVEHLGRGVQVRHCGRLETVPAGSLQKTVALGAKLRRVVAIGWGDVATAYYSTGIGDITVYMSLSPKQVRGMKMVELLRPLLRLRPVIRLLQAIVGRTMTGPGEEARERGHVEIWGQATAADGRAVEGRARTPEGYKATAIASVACVRRVLAGEAASGYQTPSSSFGADMVHSLPGFEMEIGPVREGPIDRGGGQALAMPVSSC